MCERVCECVRYPHLPLPGTQVEVQAPLEALVDEARVRGHGAQTGELPGQVRRLPVLGVQLLPGQTLTDTHTHTHTHTHTQTPRRECVELCMVQCVVKFVCVVLCVWSSGCPCGCAVVCV